VSSRRENFIKVLMIIVFVSFFGFICTFFFMVNIFSEADNESTGNNAQMFDYTGHYNNIPSPKQEVWSSIMLLPLTAYIETPLKVGKPLKIRENINLRKIIYGSETHCQDLQNRLPVDNPKELDNIFGPNVGKLSSLYPIRYEYASIACPVDADPFLPWIHDVFLNKDATHVEFVAHNKRRCRSDPSSFMEDLQNLEPQVAIMQSVSVKRIRTPRDNQNSNGTNNNHDNSNNETASSYRYRLASIEEADDDGRETRFICQFHTPIIRNNNLNGDIDVDVDGQQKNIGKKVIGETLSVFPYNYEHANYRKGNNRSKPMLSRPKNKDKDSIHNANVWNSILHFRCPVPEFLRDKLQHKNNNHNNIIGPSIYIDLVPIRTPARETNEGYCPQLLTSSSFNATEEWGTNHILPRVEDSGRWSNIPVCSISSIDGGSTEVSRLGTKSSLVENIQPYYLIGCLWASAEFSTRGDSTIDKSTSTRLLEWITYHLYIAKMDHIYVYDNTEAFTNVTSLEKVLNLFPSDRVTRIKWKHRVCCNNRPMHKNAGERSSQYAAETSCRLRYGPMTEWIAQLDVDEYLIPAGHWTDIKSWLKESVKTGKIENKTNILSFFQTRAVPNIEFMKSTKKKNGKEYGDNVTKDERIDQSLMKRDNITFLQTYDCEKSLTKPDYGWRAKKQIYRPNFVLNHFVHYSTVTNRIHEAPNEDSPLYNQRRPYERRVDELKEAFMLHTKTTYPSATRNWIKSCKGQSEEDKKKCPVGIAYSFDPIEGEDLQQKENVRNKNGFAYNCYKHHRIQNELATKLQHLLQPFLNRFHD